MIMNSHDCFNFGKSGALFTANAPLAQQKKIRGRAAGRIWTLPPSVLKGANAHSMGFAPVDGWIHPHMARNPAGIRALQNR
jgi:hypothetical protein